MILASVFIAVSTFCAKGVAGRFNEPGGWLGDSSGSSMASDIHPLQVTAGRYFFALLLWIGIYSFSRLSGRLGPMIKVHWTLHIVRTFLGWMTVTSIFWASSLMALADATAISFLTPVVTLLLAALFLGEKVGVVRLSAVAIMLCGALVLLRPGTSAFQPAAMIALLAAITSGFEVVLLKRLTALEPRLQILLINNSMGLVIALAAATLVWVSPQLWQWLLLAIVGFSMALAQLFFMTSLRDGDATLVVPFMYSTLIFVAILDYSVFGDAPDALGIVGALIIVGGAIFMAVREGVLQRRNSL